MENSFEEIKRLMKIIGGKVIVVEDGRPTMVIINADEFIEVGRNESENQKNLRGNENPVDKRLVEKVNKNINIWKNKQEEKRVRQLEKDKEEQTEEVVNDFEMIQKDNNEIVIEKL